MGYGGQFRAGTRLVLLITLVVVAYYALSALFESSSTELTAASPEDIEIHRYQDAEPLPPPKPVRKSFGGRGEGADIEKLEFVRMMMQHAWRGYENHAWGANELKPLSGLADKGFMTNAHIGVFIADSLDSLLVFGMDEEFDRARDWIANELNFDQDTAVSLFETTIRVLGGLLSAYALSKDQVFLDKAVDIGDRLYAGVVEKTIPDIWVNLKGFSDHAPGTQSLAEMGSLHVEFAYLSRATGNDKYLKAAEKIRDAIDNNAPHDGIYRNDFNGKTFSGEVSIGARGDSFYEYLLKSYLLSGKTDTRALRMYEHATGGLIEATLRTAGDKKYFSAGGSQMEHLACFTGGMFALGSRYVNESLQQQHREIGEGITNTCAFSYTSTNSGLGPEIFTITDHGGISQGSDHKYKLRPETIESLFYMYRLTHDEKYRELGWQIARAIEFHARTDYGYAIVQNVWTTPVPLSDAMPSFVIAETFKYLYLLFASDDLLPLDNWVFNTEAHPLPVDAPKHK